jgi:hypothetical protein
VFEHIGRAIGLVRTCQFDLNEKARRPVSACTGRLNQQLNFTQGSGLSIFKLTWLKARMDTFALCQAAWMTELAAG